HHSGGTRGATYKEVQRNLMGPLRFLQQRNSVVAGLGRCLRKWGACRTHSHNAEFASSFSLAANFDEPPLALGIRNARTGHKFGNAHRGSLRCLRLPSLRNARMLPPRSIPAAIADACQPFLA